MIQEGQDPYGQAPTLEAQTCTPSPKPIRLGLGLVLKLGLWLELYPDSETLQDANTLTLTPTLTLQGPDTRDPDHCADLIMRKAPWPIPHSAHTPRELY